MPLYTNEIPILEYDDCPDSMIFSWDQKKDFPARAVFAFLGDTVDNFIKAHGGEVLDVFHTITRDTPVYRITWQGQELCLCRAPLGGAAAVQMMDWLIARGVQCIIAAGSCGALVPLPENAFLIPTKALRDESASYHYLPPARYVTLSRETQSLVREVLEAQGLKAAACTTWTTDGFFRETDAMVAHRRAEGCAVVEMECAALAACAQFRGVTFGQFLYTADTLADAQNYEIRGWGQDSLEPALRLCLEIGIRLPG